MLKTLLVASLFGAQSLYAATTPQIKPVNVTPELVRTLGAMQKDSSNAWTVEQKIGPAIACLPASRTPSEAWVCQWKGNLSSNRLLNTLNITFEAGMIAQIVAIDAAGNFLPATTGSKK